MNGVAFRHVLENVAGLLVGADFSNAANMALILTEWLCDEKLN
jgi:hypothetical protein